VAIALPEQNLYSLSTRTMKNQNLALILFAIRELQGKIGRDHNYIFAVLKDYYGVEISDKQELYDTLDELAQSLNCGGENV
jgi:hypothetical protein